MASDLKFLAIRKGLLEFVLLKIVSADKVYVADILARLETLVPLAPLHQPHNLAAIRGVLQQRPDLPQVACFDTAFHHGRSTIAMRFALPHALFDQGVRRWGFHGLSYQSVTATFRRLEPDLAAGRVSWAPQLRELLGFARVRKTLGHAAAVANLAGRAPEADRPHVIDALNQHFATTVTPLTLGDQR